MAKKTVAPEVPVAVRGVQPHNITDEMRKSYIDYAMTVITGRALPDARDDLSCALFQLGWGHIGKREKGFIDGVDLDGIAKLFYDGDNALREVSVESEI